MLVRDLRRGSFRVDDEFVDTYARIVGPMAALAYMALCRHANREQEAWPAIDRIAERMGVNARSIRRGIQQLERHNVISVIRGKDEMNRRKVNVYLLMDRSVWGKAREGVHGTVSPEAPGDCESTIQGTEPGDSSALEGLVQKDTHVKGEINFVDKSESDDLKPVGSVLADIRRDLERRGIITKKYEGQKA